MYNIYHNQEEAIKSFINKLRFSGWKVKSFGIQHIISPKKRGLRLSWLSKELLAMCVGHSRSGSMVTFTEIDIERAVIIADRIRQKRINQARFRNKKGEP